jgi:hypothetical protein
MLSVTRKCLNHLGWVLFAISVIAPSVAVVTFMVGAFVIESRTQAITLRQIPMDFFVICFGAVPACGTASFLAFLGSGYCQSRLCVNLKR